MVHDLPKWSYLKCTITSGFILCGNNQGISKFIVSFPTFSDSLSGLIWDLLKLTKNNILKCLCVCAQSCPTLCSPMDCSPLAPLSMEFSRQEYWRGLPFPSSGDLPDPGIEPVSVMSSALVGGFFTTSITWEAHLQILVDGKCLTVSNNMSSKVHEQSLASSARRLKSSKSSSIIRTCIGTPRTSEFSQ